MSRSSYTTVMLQYMLLLLKTSLKQKKNMYTIIIEQIIN